MSRARTLLLALLCAVGVAALLAGCGGDEETVTVIETAPAETTTVPPAGEDTSIDDPDDDAADADDNDDTVPPGSLTLESFQTPSGNIACVVGDDGARCDIADRTWTAPRPAGCPAEMDFGQGLTVSDEGDGPGTVVCAGDTTMNPAAPVLDYGASTSVGDFTCTSEKNGVTCRDDGDNRGFFISRQSYRLF